MGRTIGTGGTGFEGGRMISADAKDLGGFVRNLQKFPLGEVVITPEAATVLSADEISKAVARHSRGDWGNVDTQTRRENEGGIGYSRLAITSRYQSERGISFWVMTKPERKQTVVMLGSIEESPSYS
jgi:hypothetical protein